MCSISILQHRETAAFDDVTNLIFRKTKLFFKKSCEYIYVCATPPRLLLFIPTQSEQLDMKMTVKIGFCDVA